MMGPGAHLRRLDCLNMKTLSHAKSHSLQMVYKQNTTRQTLLHCNTANAILGRPKKSHAVAGGPSYGTFLKVDF